MNWGILLLRTEDQPSVVQALVTAFQGLGFTPYDPFPGGAGTPIGFKIFQRHFVTPASEGWVRVVGAAAPDFAPEFITSLSTSVPLLRLGFESGCAEVNAFLNGATAPLTAFVKPGIGADLLNQVIQAEVSASTSPLKEPLPDELADFARQQGVEPGKVSKLMNRMTGMVFGKLNRQSGGEAGKLQEQASALMGGTGADWNSSGARRLIEICALLEIPSQWRTPTFEAIRDAYQVARRLERSPHAALMSDERAAYQAVPEALGYLPVYVGK